MSFIYVRPEKPFEEIEDFVKKCEEQYSIKMQIHSGDLRKCLLEILSKNSNLKACLMGQRRTDPHCSGMEYFQLTDPDWPQLMRINPLLEWSCKDIWEYISFFNVSYCTLYDKGYSSIGDRSNTIPNPYLKIKTHYTVTYKPAKELDNDLLERAGRLK